jgi:N-acetylglutamate synthase-like GNAT family acetyltransferase
VDVLAKRLIDHHPEMMLEDHFVIKHKNRIVACLNLIAEKWSIGEIPLKVAEMGCVATLPEFRHRGLIRTLVNEFHKRVATHGYDLDFLSPSFSGMGFFLCVWDKSFIQTKPNYAASIRAYTGFREE